MTKNKAKQKVNKKHIPLLVLAVVFNVFVFGVFFVIYQINEEFDLVSEKRILFNQPNPEILADVNEMLEGYPMQSAAPYIATQNRQVAAFLVAIAKKESAWGEHTPKLNGQECYNYWGYRGKRKRMGSGGHTCFDSQKDAVRTVSRRIRALIRKGYDTPEKMVVWKCGSCTGPAAVGAEKWISDVDLYYKKISE